MVRFLHTSDWQLGITRHFFSEGTQERFSQARYDAVLAMGNIAREEGCGFILVCGDAFESNQVDRKTVARAAEALRQVPVSVYILPGNHDPLNAASVYLSRAFKENKPDNVTVIENSDPIDLGDGVELVGAPWFSKKPDANPVTRVLDDLAPAKGTMRILAAHGVIDALSPDKDVLDIIAVASLEKAVAEEKAHFVALGDRHSLTRVGTGDRIWYSGTPETTDFTEMQSGCAQVVEINGPEVTTTPVQVGQWRFVARGADLSSQEDIDMLQTLLEEMERKELTVVRLSLVGSLSLSLSVALQERLDRAGDVFAAFVVKDDDLLVIPDDTDFKDFGFSGFADAAVQRLRDEIEQGEEGEKAARDALMLLMRLVGDAP